MLRDDRHHLVISNAIETEVSRYAAHTKTEHVDLKASRR